MKKKQDEKLENYKEFSAEQMKRHAKQFFLEMKNRRSVRDFSSRSVPREIIENCLRTAGTAPSGANKQPWYFVVVTHADLKKKIRHEAEKREQEFYQRAATKKWVQDLAPLGTNASKPFLEQAPYLIVIFAQRHSFDQTGKKQPHYYVTESVGIATGLLIASLHHSGLVCLTYTPPKIGFLNPLLNRPQNERPVMILVTGYPSKEVLVPALTRKSLDRIAQFV